jgi:hypothetical protein
MSGTDLSLIEEEECPQGPFLNSDIFQYLQTFALDVETEKALRPTCRSSYVLFRKALMESWILGKCGYQEEFIVGIGKALQVGDPPRHSLIEILVERLMDDVSIRDLLMEKGDDLFGNWFVMGDVNGCADIRPLPLRYFFVYSLHALHREIHSDVTMYRIIEDPEGGFQPSDNLAFALSNLTDDEMTYLKVIFYAFTVRGKNEFENYQVIWQYLNGGSDEGFIPLPEWDNNLSSYVVDEEVMEDPLLIDFLPIFRFLPEVVGFEGVNHQVLRSVLLFIPFHSQGIAIHQFWEDKDMKMQISTQEVRSEAGGDFYLNMVSHIIYSRSHVYSPCCACGHGHDIMNCDGGAGGGKVKRRVVD